MTDDPLTPAEEAFRALLQDPGRYARWAAEVRKRWAERREIAKAKAPPKVGRKRPPDVLTVP